MDHTVVILPAGSKLKPVCQKNRIWDCRRHRKEALYLELVRKTWDSVLEKNDVDEAVNNFKTIIHRYMDKCMPFRTVCISSCDPVWVTPLLKSLMRSKSRIGQNRGIVFRKLTGNQQEKVKLSVRTGEIFKHLWELGSG